MLRDAEVPKEPENGNGSQLSFRVHLFLEVTPLKKISSGRRGTGTATWRRS
jgi:hypothetical protein